MANEPFFPLALIKRIIPLHLPLLRKGLLLSEWLPDNGVVRCPCGCTHPRDLIRIKHNEGCAYDALLRDMGYPDQAARAVACCLIADDEHDTDMAETVRIEPYTGDTSERIMRKAIGVLMADFTKEDWIAFSAALGGYGDQLLDLANTHVAEIAPEIFENDP